ncbi:MAG TPA: hypothetical protein VGF92_07820 [Stellaceae bacterium]|jgi:hypothetical protein
MQMTGLPREIARDLIALLLAACAFSFVGCIVCSNYHWTAMRSAWLGDQTIPSGRFDKILFYFQPMPLSAEFFGPSDRVTYHRTRMYLASFCAIVLVFIGMGLVFLFRLASGDMLY